MQKFIFDGQNRLFIIKPGIIYINVKTDLYSDYKKELLIEDNSKYLEAIRVVGGDSLAGSSLDGYFFLKNGWKIRPQEANHILVVDGNLFLDEGETGDIIVPTIGNYNVLIRQIVSNIVNVVSTGESNPAAVADAVWSNSSATLLSDSLSFVSSSVSFVSSSVDYLSSSMSEVSSSNLQTYDMMLVLSQSIETISGSDPNVIAETLLNAYVDGDTVKDTLNNIDNKVISILTGSEQLIEECYKLLKIQQGRWKIENNQMIIYDEDNQTPLFKFNLYDENGNPTSTSVFERIPI